MSGLQFQASIIYFNPVLRLSTSPCRPKIRPAYWEFSWCCQWVDPMLVISRCFSVKLSNDFLKNYYYHSNSPSYHKVDLVSCSLYDQPITVKIYQYYAVYWFFGGGLGVWSGPNWDDPHIGSGATFCLDLWPPLCFIQEKKKVYFVNFSFSPALILIRGMLNFSFKQLRQLFGLHNWDATAKGILL